MGCRWSWWNLGLVEPQGSHVIRCDICFQSSLLILLQRSYSILAPELRDTKKPAPRDTRCSDISRSTSSMAIVRGPSFEAPFSSYSNCPFQYLSASFYEANLSIVVVYLTLSFAFPPTCGGLFYLPVLFSFFLPMKRCAEKKRQIHGTIKSLLYDVEWRSRTKAAGKARGPRMMINPWSWVVRSSCFPTPTCRRSSITDSSLDPPQLRLAFDSRSRIPFPSPPGTAHRRGCAASTYSTLKGCSFSPS